MCDDAFVSSFIVSLLEQGRKRYGVGVSRPVCLILDRGPYERDGEPKVDKMDMSVIPNLVKVFQHLYGTVMVSGWVDLSGEWVDMVGGSERE